MPKSLTAPNRTYRGNYFQGQFHPIDDPNGEVFSVNPGDLDVPRLACPFAFAHVPEAIASARAAFRGWRRSSHGDRAAALARYRELMVARTREIAGLVTFETGKPLWEAMDELREAAEFIEYCIAHGGQTTHEDRVEHAAAETTGTVRYQSRGVVVVIAPAIQPIFDAVSHWVPALVNGNTVVLKASRQAPLVGQFMAEISHDAGFPAGVFNVIQGDAEVSQRLVSDPEVDAVFFTGSYETALKIKKQTLSDYGKLLVLDMVGKNGMLVWEDCDYKKSLNEALLACFLSTGQRRTTTSRVLVHHKIYDRFISDFHAAAKRVSIGYGYVDENAPFMGPLLSEGAVENYLRYQGIATREGCEEIMRGKALERENGGHYISPSIYLVKKPDAKSVYQKTEIFGPNVAFYKVGDLEEAAEILNLPQHGLIASVYTSAREHFMKLVEEVRVGTLNWNRPSIHPSYRVPYGGIKRSGNNRPMGSFAGLQCTYPISALEFTGKFDPTQLPASFPRTEGKE